MNKAIKHVEGMALVPTLIITVIITLAAVTAMQNSGIQGKMTANYRHEAEIFNETNNELTAQFNELKKENALSGVISNISEVKGSTLLLSNITSPTYSEASLSEVKYLGVCATCASGFDLNQFEGLSIEIGVKNKAMNVVSTQYAGASVVVPSL